ncbi:MAG: T9SS type A sorting domain-containing protein [Bacteroidia bacterium]|nr:T9SS type A sorting domain-containing protein [Bacteroidia bacterium]
MKTKKLMRRRIALLGYFLFLLPLFSQAQTTLALGDIAFTGYNSDGATNEDDFCFVILKSTGIQSGTTIYFTDRGWKSGSCGTNNFCSTIDNGSFPESGSQFFWTSGSSLSYGTHVRISKGTPTSCSNCFTCSNGSAYGLYLNLSTGGDQIFALQNGAGSTDTANGASGTMLTAIHANKATAAGCSFSTSSWDNCTSNISSDICATASNSNKPACLTNGTNCLVLLDGSSAEVDNGVYNCTSASSNTSAAAINAMRTAINNTNNWTTNDASVVTIPPSGCSPLPVSWVYFNANATTNGTMLEWGTALEVNCSHFEVQRSFDLSDWQTVQHVTGGGTKNKPTAYWFEDIAVRDRYQLIYYRIKQVDFNGWYEYTPVRTTEKKHATAGYTAFSFNGNPFSENTVLKTFLPNDGQAHIEILDASGHPVFDRMYEYHGGYNRFNPYTEAPAAIAKPGFYFIRASIEGETKVFKLLVQ